MSTSVGELNIKLNLELARLDAQIKASNQKIASMGRRMQSDLQKAARAINSTLGSIGIGVGFGAIVSFGKSILDLGGKITDLATQANLSTDAFQTFANAGRSLELPASRSPTRSTSWLNLFRMLPRGQRPRSMHSPSSTLRRQG